MEEQSLACGSRTGKGQHHDTVQTVAPHVVIAVERTATQAEIFCGYEQCAWHAVNVVDDELVVAVGIFVYGDDAIASVVVMDVLSLIFGNGLRVIVDDEGEQGSLLGFCRRDK